MAGRRGGLTSKITQLQIKNVILLFQDSFRGLRSDSRPMALLDGSKGSLWYWAVGAASTYLAWLCLSWEDHNVHFI